MKAKVLFVSLLVTAILTGMTSRCPANDDIRVGSTTYAQVTAFVEDGDYMWIGTDTGVTKLHKTTGEIVSFYSENDYGVYDSSISTFAIDNQGNVWIATNYDGLAKFDGENWTVYDTSNSVLPQNIIHDLAVDNQGNVWIATNYGLVKYEGDNWTVYQTSTSDIPSNRILDLASDGQGNLWMTTGIGVIHYDGENWTYYKRDNSDSSLPVKDINLVEVDGKGTVWIGSIANLVKFDGENWSGYRRENFGLESSSVNALVCDSEGNVWIGNDTGVSRFDGENYTVYTSDNSGLPEKSILTLAVDSEGTLWIGTDEGLFAFDGAVFKQYEIGTLEGPDTWTRKTDMPTPRSDLATCVVNGKIYAIGGKWDFDYPTIGSSPYSRVEVYDPETDIWTEKTPIPTNRRALSLSVVNGKIYAIGGNNEEDSNNFLPGLTTVEEYDPATDTWTTKADMPTGRLFLSTHVVDGKIYAIGGNEKYVHGKIPEDWVYSPLATVEVYDPVTDSWATKEDMLHTSGEIMVGTSCAANGKIYAFSPSNVDEYDPEKDSWTIKADMPLKIHYPVSCEVNGKIYIIGNIPGTGGPYLSNTVASTLEYDPVTNTFAEKATMPSGRMQYSACTFNGKIFVIGGLFLKEPDKWACESVSTVYVYDTGFRPEPTLVESVPAAFQVLQNYPNPFNPATTINYRMDQAGMVNLVIYDLLGRKATTLVDEMKYPGSYAVTWNAEDFASGIYFCRIERDGGKTLTQKMMLIK